MITDTTVITFALDTGNTFAVVYTATMGEIMISLGLFTITAILALDYISRMVYR